MAATSRWTTSNCRAVPSSKKRAWLTPDTEDAAADLICRRFFVPDTPAFRESVSGALLELTYAWNWELDGSMTPEEAAAIMLTMYNDYALAAGCATAETPTPFWDTADDLDDENTPAAQGWYGYVDQAEGDPETLTFFENAAIWTLTGLLAISGNVGAAILFNTTAPRFHLAVRAGDVGEIIRILFDNEEKARIDTSDYDAGEVIRVPIVGDPAETTHDLLIIKVE